MATTNKIRALNRLPYDFQDGLKIGGVDVTALNQIATANGASLVGYDGGTVQDVMDSAKPMADYVALRAYAGRATQVRITSNGIAGFFYYDASDTVSADNGGTIIVDASGRRWKRIFDGLLNVKWFGAKGDGKADDTAAIQSAINASVGKTLTFPGGNYLIAAGLSFASWSGGVAGNGVIQCQSGIAISQVLNFTNAANVNWNGVGLDMGQTSTTVDAGPRTDSGFYFYDSRDCRVSDVTISNVRIGEPIYVNGTSSVSPSATHGSKRIFFDNITCVAFSNPTVDVGASVYIRSDFFTGDGGGIYFSASNACKKSDYTLDAAVAYQRTTSDIFFNNCYFANFDRIGYFNVKNVHFSNCKLVNFFTRGHSLSPSCEGIAVVGGSISGNAAQINANFACKDLVFADLVADGGPVSAGQRHSLRAGFGTQRVRFSNIVGLGNDTALVYLEGVSDVAFEGVSLNNWPGGITTYGVVINAGESSNTSSFVTKNVVFSNCKFASNYSLKFDNLVAGTATVEARGIKFVNCYFERVFQLFNGVQPIGGQIEWVSTTANYSGGSPQNLDPRAFSVYEGGNISMKMWDTFYAGGATTYPTFATVYFPTTRKDGAGGDSVRVPPVLAYVLKSGDTFYQPLIYGIDWFIDGTMAENPMINQIRMYTPGVLAAGDTVAIQRIR